MKQPEPLCAVPADENTESYEDIYAITTKPSLPGYKKLDPNTREEKNYHSYQKLIKFFRRVVK